MKPGFAWSDDYALGHDAMDDMHREFVACVDALLKSPDDRLAAALEAFADHARRHFAEEDEAMRGTVPVIPAQVGMHGPGTVIPAQAGIHELAADPEGVDSRLRGNDGFPVDSRLRGNDGFPSAGCHLDEHAAVLKSLEEVQAALAQGNAAVVRGFARALADWFPEHARVMDLGLARWLVQRRLGGSPVVVRPRRVAALT